MTSGLESDYRIKMNEKKHSVVGLQSYSQYHPVIILKGKWEKKAKEAHLGVVSDA